MDATGSSIDRLMNYKDYTKIIDENFTGESKCFDFGNLLLNIDVQSHTIHGHLNGDDFLFNSLDYVSVLRFIFGVAEDEIQNDDK